MKNILIISSDSKESQSVCAFARRLGYSCLAVPDCHEALDVVREQKVDMAVLDLSVSDRDFCMVMDKYLENCSEIPLILFSSSVEGAGDIELVYSRTKFLHMSKPVTFDDFIRKTEKVFTRKTEDDCAQEGMQMA